MLPVHASHNSPDGPLREPEVLPDSLVGFAPASANGAHIISGDFCFMVSLSPARWARGMRAHFSPSGNAIIGIIFGRAAPKVTRIATGSIVTRVENKKRFIEISKGQEKRDPVCQLRMLSPEASSSISISVLESAPRPTFVRTSFVDLAPKNCDSVSFVSESRHKKTAQRASAWAVSPAVAENGKSRSVSCQTVNTRTVAKSPVEATVK